MERPGLKVSGGAGAARSLLSRVSSRWRSTKPRLEEEERPGGRRFLSDQARGRRTAGLLEAARSYVRRKPAGEKLWLYRKPFDPAPGNPAFYQEMYQILNLLQAMGITPGGRVLEVGSGPGWVSEILMQLGFEVDALEPSQDMIEIASERIRGAVEHHRLERPPRVTFHCRTLEACDLPSDAFDAVLFHEALHHVIDEVQGLRQTFRVLRPGGVVGVTEWAWRPGDAELEAVLEEEMARYGTLENPFCPDYLDRLLREVGFVTITRYHAVNGFLPLDQGGRPLEEVAEAPAASTNNLTARKPAPGGRTSRDFLARTTGEVEVLERRLGGSGKHLELGLRLTNTGETVWLATGGTGEVHVALVSGDPGDPDHLEAVPRIPLPRNLPPGESVTLTASFRLPRPAVRWFVHLVNEQLFWFSARGMIPPIVSTEPAVEPPSPR